MSNPMVRSNRALKRARSIRNNLRKESTFSYVVRKQKNLCWYCNGWMGTDVTKEHLHPQCQGGTDSWPRGNLKAAHSACNMVVGHLPVEIKRQLRRVCRRKGTAAMFEMARQFRRAQARDAFVAGMP